ncbi:hypothetical protein HZC20_01335 [Candidatus Peregrinibacteria bacterium]|nr:hypothetical protein [Candidatus Peregrinibacteria bacterium]
MSRKEVAELLYRSKTVSDNILSYYDDKYTPNEIKHSQSKSLDLSFDNVSLTFNNDPKLGDKLGFSLYIGRPDLKLYETEYADNPDVLTTDLPQALQPKLMYVSETSDTDKKSGSMCDRPRFPHLCEVNLQGDYKKRPSKKIFNQNTFRR